MKLVLIMSPSILWLFIMAAITTSSSFLSVPVAAAAVASVVDGGGPPTPNVERIEYVDTFDPNNSNTTLVGFMAMPQQQQQQVPALVIIPDWDGVNYYEQQRVTLAAADLGYVAMVADIYGYEGTVENITERRALANYYRTEQPQRFMQRIQVAVNYVAALPQVDATKIAVAGYCFGGSGVLMYAVDDSGIREEQESKVAAVVSFHGGLSAVLEYHNPNTTSSNRPRVLVLSGGDDDMASDIMTLETQLDNATVALWEITRYAGIEHAFTVWDDDRYNEWADTRSWMSMKQFLQETFGEIVFESPKPSSVQVEAVQYVDETDGKELQGYLAKPDPTLWQTPSPVIVIIPDWDGVNLYEQERATLLASEGYVAFAADIYGADLQENLDFDTRIEQSTFYRSQNVDLFVSRMQRAVELVQSYDFVDSNNTALIGYCFGGTGVIQYAFMGRDDIKLVAAYHGNVQEQFLPPVMQDILPYTMVLSGGEDDAHGNQTILEDSLNMGNADWEITRYSGVFHGFTDFDGDAYNLNADIRSWTAMHTALEMLMAAPMPTSTNGDMESSSNNGDANVMSTNGGDDTSAAATSGCLFLSLSSSLVFLVGVVFAL